MKLKMTLGVMAAIGLGAVIAACAPTSGSAPKPVGKSGTYYYAPETVAMQKDDFDNPGMLWVDIGKDEYSKIDGKAGKSCKACHGDVKSFKGLATKGPWYSKVDKKLRTIQDQINWDRTKRMKTKAWKWDSDQMNGMVSYIKMQSRGLPINPVIDGPAKPFFEAGKKFYNQRRGQLDMSCANCHVAYPGSLIRSNKLSEGMPNAFPEYRLKWQKVGSLHRRFKGCNKNIRAQPYKQGSDEYTNLELFITWRARGLPVETPGVRM